VITQLLLWSLDFVPFLVKSLVNKKFKSHKIHLNPHIFARCIIVLGHLLRKRFFVYFEFPPVLFNNVSQGWLKE